MENNEEEKDENSYPKITRLNEFQSNHKYIFRLCLLGDSFVGKTSILTKYSDGEIPKKYNSTIGADFKVITLELNDIITKIHIWDTAGQERFKSITVNYFKNSHGFIFVYDITNRESFENLNNWIDLAFQNNQNHFINFLIGNKCDLENDRKVSIEEGKNFAEKKKFIFLETSAKDNININKVFEFFTYKLISYYEKNKEEYQGDSNQRRLSKAQVINTVREKKKCDC